MKKKRYRCIVKSFSFDNLARGMMTSLSPAYSLGVVVVVVVVVVVLIMISNRLVEIMFVERMAALTATEGERGGGKGNHCY